MNNLIQPTPEHLPAGEVSHPPLTCNPVFRCGLRVVVANALVSPPYFCPGGTILAQVNSQVVVAWPRYAEGIPSEADIPAACMVAA